MVLPGMSAGEEKRIDRMAVLTGTGLGGQTMVCQTKRK